MPFCSAHRSYFLVLVLGMLVAFSASAEAQTIPSLLESRDERLGGRAVITGTVFGPDGHRLRKRMRVKLVTDTKGDRIMSTNDEGIFVIRGLANGEYTVLIDKEDHFEPFSQSIRIINGQDVHLSVRLDGKRSEEAKPGVVNAALAGTPKEAVEAFEKAAEFAKKNDLNSAIQQLRIATTTHPEFALAHGELGSLLIRLGRLEEAERSLRTALAITPDARAPQINLGIALYHMRRFSEAETLWRKIVEGGQNPAVAHYFLGQTLVYLAKYDEAIPELEAAIKLGGKKMKDAHKSLAFVYGEKGDDKRAAEHLETYLKLEPDAPDASQLRDALARLKTRGSSN
ncbi:MAG: tetratricopeptide repeat protein [Pyrinomonadaceae bacterium]